MTKYITTKQTNIWRLTPGTLDIFGQTASVVVGTLSVGQIFDVESVGSGGTGIIATPYLNLPNGDWVSGWDAHPYTGSSSNTNPFPNTLPKSVNNIPTPVKAVLGLAAIFIFLKVVKVI